ncbi:hypothetical protein HLB23_17015 [Nocardia uniformis]|uniref:Uncharacterized protein n=2 Tax=Nocardia uniformis TaxID=53432 RepID=A0A849C208_9NOCA|nr:hypothetical protein [Nocardia uniformis]NNH71546.1 hypothetical protein [Nocardia uniformis]
MLVVSVAMLVVSCGSDSDEPGQGAGRPPTSTTRLLERVPAPDPASPEGVAVEALHEIFTWYPATEQEGAALGRARKWLGPSLIRTLDSTTPTAVETPKATVRWADWGKAGATVEAFTFASGAAAPGADPNRQQYKIGIEQTVVYPDGRREPLAPSTVVATVVRTTDGWRLDEFH